MYFYDVLSYLEHELQLVRNNKSGRYVRKALYNQELSYGPTFFNTTDDDYNADDFYGPKWKRFTKTKMGKELSKLKNRFHDSYDYLESSFGKAKDALDNYINFINEYFVFDFEIEYRLISNLDTKRLVDKQQKTKQQIKTFEFAFCDLKYYYENFMIDTYDKGKYKVPIVRSFKGNNDKAGGFGRMKNTHTSTKTETISYYNITINKDLEEILLLEKQQILKWSFDKDFDVIHGSEVSSTELQFHDASVSFIFN
jgi:hypothetical protein